MNPVQQLQIDQILPQVSVQSNINTESTPHTDTTFEAALERSVDSENVEAKDEVKSENKTSKLQNPKDTKEIQDTQNQELIAQEFILPALADYLSEEVPAINLTMDASLLEPKLLVSDENITDVDTINVTTSGITLDQLSWLENSDSVDFTDDIESLVDVDISNLLQNAREFVPGEEDEREKLLLSQELSVSEPEAFLQKLSEGNSARVEIDSSTVALKGESLVSEEVKPVKEDDKKKVQDTKASKTRFTVKDERTLVQVDKESTAVKAVTKPSSKDNSNLNFDKGGQTTQDFSVNLADTSRQNITASSAQSASAAGSTFEGMLSNAIQQNAPEFVKAGSIILKDNNAGQINLILQPESLGNVKISLSLSDKVISGQINVSSQAAYDAFKENIAVIRDAFIQSGFEANNFDLSYTGQQSFAQGEQGSGSNDGSYMAKSVYGEHVMDDEDAVSSSLPPEYGVTSSGVNIVA